MTSEKIKYALDNRKLKLSFWETVQHYGIVGFCFVIPITLTVVHLKEYFNNSHKPIKSGELWLIIIPTILGIIFFFIQKSKLKFKEVNTDLNKLQISKIIEDVAEELEWHLQYSNSKVIVAKTHPGFLSGSWGEKITIVFDHKKVLVNSICDLDKKSSLVSMGRNGQNEHRLIEDIKKANSQQRV